MNLYLDLNKAVQIPSTGTDSVTGARAARSYEESFTRHSSGALGGDASPDDPDVGRKWRKAEQGDPESLDAELEKDREKDSQIAQERGIVVRKEEVKDTNKALEILKSLSGDLHEQLAYYMPNEREVEYLTVVKGNSVEDVMKGYVRISGYERARFNEWLHTRLMSSIHKLVVK
jgi:hypothetical protein